MAIETNNLVIYKSERLTDTPDGGGKYSGQVVQDGISNNLFNDVSELDRTVGDVSMRKVFAGVTSEDTDTLMGATVFVSENPSDPNVSALLFSTESATDTRNSAQNRVENYLAKGAQIAGTPLDTLWQGMKFVQVAMFEEDTESTVGDTIVLVSNEGKSNEAEQYLRITSVETTIAYMIIDGKQVAYKNVAYGVNDALSQDFVGLSARQWYNGQQSTTIIRDTIVADTGNYYASVALATDATVGEYTVNAESMFSQIIPSAQTETPLLDLNAVSESIALVAGNSSAITVNIDTTVNVDQSLYLGSSVMPNSFSTTIFGQAITDNAGLLKTNDGTQVGTIDYQNGHIVWNNAIGSGNQKITVSFIPASAPTQPSQSYSILVTQNNQSNNWTGVLVPIPSPASLIVSFMSQGRVYQGRDNGSGRLVFASDSIGTGTINYTTGTFLLTTGALPDVDTPILLQWATPITTFARADLSVSPASIAFDLEQEAIAVNSVTANWTLEGVPKSATSDAYGNFTGDAIGSINYAKGTGTLIPKELPQKGTVFSFAFDYGDPKSQTVSSGTPTDGAYSFTIGTGSAIQPNSVSLDIPVNEQAGVPFDGTYGAILTVHDVPIDANTGNLVDRHGNVQGTITYATGAVDIEPTMTGRTYYESVYYAVSYTSQSGA